MPRPQTDRGATATLAIAWNAAPADSEKNPQPAPGKPFEMLLAGLVGVQAWYSRIPQQAAKTRAPLASSSDRDAAAAPGRFGRWIPAANAEQGTETLMLDRRTRQRPSPGRKLPSGAIEETAQKWLNSASGVHSDIQSTRYGDKIPGHAVIDWGGDLAPRSVAGAGPAAKTQKPDRG